MTSSQEKTDGSARRRLLNVLQLVLLVAGALAVLGQLFLLGRQHTISSCENACHANMHGCSLPCDRILLGDTSGRNDCFNECVATRNSCIQACSGRQGWFPP